MNKPEILAPAGNLETLKVAVLYGADAVYIGGQTLSLRAMAKNFTIEDIRLGVEFAHKHDVKLYVTVNVFAHNEDFIGMESYIKDLYEANVDALIISDPGIFRIVKSVAPDMECHLSTQANNTNYSSALFWHEQGYSRVVVARELSFDEIATIRSNIPSDLKLEAFVHGAMCISYSGRCLLSNYMINRDANRGACAHPCRWKYYLVEETREGQYMPIEEDSRGTYIYNSKDLCMIDSIDKLVKSGIDSFKIEGRMKTPLYVATVVSAYRRALDDYFEDENIYYDNIESYIEEIKKASHREYTHGFYLDKPGPNEQIYNSNDHIRNYNFIGIVMHYDEEKGIAKIQQRNKFCINDEIEVLRHNGENIIFNLDNLYDENMNALQCAPHPKQVVYIKTKEKLNKYEILRKKV